MGLLLWASVGNNSLAGAQTLPTPSLSSPPNGSTGQPTTLTLAWGESIGAGNYRVQVSTSSSFSTIAIDSSGVTSTTAVVNGLASNATYYWRVRAHSLVFQSNWSAVWNFVTRIDPPQAPTLSTPLDGATGQPTTITLAWVAPPGGQTYHIQLSTTASFTSTILNDSTTTATTRQVGSLAANTSHFWRVRAKNAGGASPWSSVWGFTTAGTIPGIVTLTLPANGSTNLSTTLNMNWNTVSGADRYHLQVSSSSSFGTLVVNDSSLTTTSRQVSSLSTGTTYYWRVKASNASGGGNWSATWNFTTLVNPPPSPALLSPNDTSSNQPLTLTLTWNPSSGTQTYRVQVSLTAAFTSAVVDDSTATSPTLQVGPLAANTLHYWRVRAKNSGGSSTWSSVWRFTTIAALPVAPALGTPINGATNQSTTLSLTWSGVTGADRYHLQVSTASSFSVLTLNDSSIAGTSRQATPLNAGTTYYWRVRGMNNGGAGSWSSTWNFQTASGPPPPPAVPTLLSPLNGASNQPVTLRLSWHRSQHATSYQVQASTSPAFAVMVVNSSGIVDTSLQVGPLADSTTYYWRVRAVNDSGPSNWSASRNFTTAPSQPASLDAPELVSPPNGTTGQPTTLLLQWNEVLGATSYRVQVSANTAFSPMVIDQAGVTSTSYTASGLSAATSYYWRVRSSSLVLTSGWSNVWTFSTLGGVPAAPALSSPTNNTVQSTTSVRLAWGAAAGATAYHVQLGKSAAFATLFINDSVVTGSPYDVAGLDTVATYYWRVRARGTTGWSQYSVVWAFSTTSPIPSTVMLNWTTTFPELASASDYGPADYRIVGLPGSSEAPLQSFLTGNVGSEWMSYWDNGGANSFLVPFNGDTTFRCLQGRAFWLIRKGLWTVNSSVRAAQLDSSHQAEIVIHPGWNLVTNPFTTSVPWSVVQFANSFTDPLFKFDGGFSTSSSLDPYIGYYFFNASGRSVLCIPTPGDRMRKPLLPTVSATVQGGDGWRMNVQLAAGNYIDSSVWLGVAPGAQDGMDQRDYRKPRGIGSLPSVYFSRPAWDSIYTEFATDIRPGFNSLNEWHLTVKAGVRVPASITFRGINQIPNADKVYLIDDDRMVHVDLREDSVYRFIPMRPSSIFRIVTGNEHSVAALLQSLRTPESFALEGNFPNPFNPSTVISFLVPNSDAFELKVYDALGREVRVLFAGQLPAGRQYVEWDGTDERGVHVSSGVYFCRMVGQMGVHAVLKLMLVK